VRLRYVLDDLCSRFGLCLPAAQREQLLVTEHFSAESLARAVFEAEGLDPADHCQLYAAAVNRIQQHMG
jgi:hypothetical protein